MNNLMRRSGIVAVLCLMLCLCLLICSCGGKGNDDETTADPNANVTTGGGESTNDPGDVTTEPAGDETTEPTPTTVTYTVTVKNAAGEALENVSVQLCSTTCTPGKTNASGVATFELAEGVYQAQITAAVEGYLVDTAKKYDFAAGETALVIVLEAAPVVEDNTINLRTDEDVLNDYRTNGDEEYYVYYYYVANMEAENEEEAAIAVKKGDSVVYVFEATGDGELFAYVRQGLGVKVSMKNLTTGVTYLPLSGVGALDIPTVAGNTYEITVEYTLDEEVLYFVAGAMVPDGTKDAPYHLYEGLISTEVVIPEGETVWFYLEESYLLIENPSVKVNVNGTIYAPNAQGVIDMSVLEYPDSGLIGISSSIADAKVEIKLSGSSEDAPLYLYNIEDLYNISFAGKTVCVAIPTVSQTDIIRLYAYNGKVEALALIGMMSMTEEVEDADSSDDTVVVDASGYRFLLVKVENADSLYARVETIAPQGSSAENPFVIESLGEIEIDRDTIDAFTVSGTNFMGMPITQCNIYYTYTATEYGVIDVFASQVDGGVNAICVMVIETAEGGWSYAWEMSEMLPGGQQITLNAGDTVIFYVEFSAAQIESTEGATLTLGGWS